MTRMLAPRPCGTHSDHVPHPWAGGRHWCRGYGRYAEDAQPAPVPAATGETCGHRYVGPTGVTWVCHAPPHHTDPTRGLAGSGHTMFAVTGPRG